MGDLAAIRRYKRALATYERAGKARSAAFEALFKPGDRIRKCVLVGTGLEAR